jgi:hypothetical protein
MKYFGGMEDNNRAGVFFLSFSLKSLTIKQPGLGTWKFIRRQIAVRIFLCTLCCLNGR